MTSTSIIGGASIFWILPNPMLPCIISPQVKSIPLIIISLGVITGIFFLYSSKQPSNLLKLPLISHALCTIWFLVPSSTQIQLKAPLLLSHLLLKSVDHSWLELISGQGINKSFSSLRTKTLLYRPKTPTNILLLTATTLSRILFIQATI
jgi:hypothetical protein